MAQAVRAQDPQVDVQCVDALEYTRRWFHAFYAQTYLFLVRYVPWVWRVSYALLDWEPVYRMVQPIRRRWNLWISRPFAAWLQQTQPDLIVTTHFLPADVASALKAAGWLTSRLVVVVTDLYPHRFWTSSNTDAVVVATPEGRRVLIQRGVPSERVHVLGIPIAPAFSAAMDREALRGRWQLAPRRRTVLVTSGGTTVGQFERVVETLVALEAVLPQRLQLLIVCGEDERARRRLSKRAASSPVPMRVFGFVDHMAELMAASDVIVAKAGGLTVSEALGRGVPLILYHVIPGQERLNAEHVARHGAGLIARRPRDVAQIVRRLMERPEQLARMEEAAWALSRPDAASAIVSQIVGPLLRPGDISILPSDD